MNLKKIATILLPVFVFAFTILPAFAEGNDIVRNNNRAEVMNGVMIGANTGGNIADGSYAGNGGSGGAINNDGSGEEEGSGDVRDSSTGNGGAGGNSGDGGTIFSGDATTEVMIENDVNSNRTEITRCGGCIEEVPEEVTEEDTTEENDNVTMETANGDVRIVSRNEARVGNMVGSMSDTGMNYALGSEAGTGGSGGKIQNTGDGDVDTGTTGDGAIGGNSAAGGLIQSGVAVSRTHIMNVVNTNVTRLSR